MIEPFTEDARFLIGDWRRIAPVMNSEKSPSLTCADVKDIFLPGTLFKKELFNLGLSNDMILFRAGVGNLIFSVDPLCVQALKKGLFLPSRT